MVGGRAAARRPRGAHTLRLRAARSQQAPRFRRPPQSVSSPGTLRAPWGPPSGSCRRARRARGCP
eukprot:4928077-Alexandrium_andersonii.AAC.1